MGNLYAATPGQSPGVARMYIYKVHLRVMNGWFLLARNVEVHTCVLWCAVSRGMDAVHGACDR